MDQLQETLDLVFEEPETLKGIRKKYFWLCDISLKITKELGHGTNLSNLCFQESQRVFKQMINHKDY